MHFIYHGTVIDYVPEKLGECMTSASLVYDGAASSES